MTAPASRPNVESSPEISRKELGMTDPRQVTAEGVAAVNAHDEARIRAVERAS